MSPDAKRLMEIVALCKDAVKVTCAVIYDYHDAKTGASHIFGRGFVLVDRFTTRASVCGGNRLLLMRTGALAVQNRVGMNGEWRAGWTANGQSDDILRDGASYFVEPLEQWAENILPIYSMEAIVSGCLALLGERERSLARGIEGVRARRRRAFQIAYSVGMYERAEVAP